MRDDGSTMIREKSVKNAGCCVIVARKFDLSAISGECHNNCHKTKPGHGAAARVWLIKLICRAAEWPAYFEDSIVISTSYSSIRVTNSIIIFIKLAC